MKKNKIIKTCMTVAITVMIIFFMIITVDFVGFEKLPPIIREIYIPKGISEEIKKEEKDKSEIKLPSTTKKEEVKNEEISENIVFSDTGKKAPYLTFNGKTEESKIEITDGGRTINFRTPLFAESGDKVIVYYWITNNNQEDAKVGNLTCHSPLSSKDKTLANSSKEEIETIDDTLVITSKNELKGTTIAGGTSTRYAGTIEIELINVPISNQEIINYEISCEMQAY